MPPPKRKQVPGAAMAFSPSKKARGSIPRRHTPPWPLDDYDEEREEGDQYGFDPSSSDGGNDPSNLDNGAGRNDSGELSNRGGSDDPGTPGSGGNPNNPDKPDDRDKQKDLEKPGDSGGSGDSDEPSDPDDPDSEPFEVGSPKPEEEVVYPYPGQKCLPEIDYEEDPGRPVCQGIMEDKPFSAQCNNPPIEGTKFCEAHKEQGEAGWDIVESGSSDEELTSPSEPDGSATELGVDDELPYWDDSDDGVCPLEYESSGWAAANQQGDAAGSENEEEAIVGNATPNTKVKLGAQQDRESSDEPKIPSSSQPTERSERDDVAPIEETDIDDGNLADTEKDEHTTTTKKPELERGTKRKAPEDDSDSEEEDSDSEEEDNGTEDEDSGSEDEDSDPEERFHPRKLSRKAYPVFDNRQVIYYEHNEGSIFGRLNPPEEFGEASGSHIEGEIEPEAEGGEASVPSGESSMETKLGRDAY